MSEVATCPRCLGDKRVNGEPCPTCNGSGVVWRDLPAQESADVRGGEDPTELRGV